ncbi:MAG: hypothetical protein KAU41_01325 [Deltaproteobacteria bacterium]|nr:hypothetical protein [Deltaproteobacteria bacterium]
MPSWDKLGHLMQAVDYGIVLPAMARMPLVLGENLSRLRGALQAIIDYDWRSMALGKRYVRKDSYEAIRIIMPEAGKRRWLIAAFERFIYFSKEEWEASLFGQQVMSSIAKNCLIDGLPELLRIQRQGRGLVMVTAHFDSYLMGMVLLGMKGLRSNLVTSSVVENPRVHPAVRSYFNRKYRAMEYRMGGKLVHFEVDLSFFNGALERGETVFLVADTQGSRSTVSIPFLGASFRMPLGAWHMAKKTGSAIGAFVCLHQAPGRYRVVCLSPQDIDYNSPGNTMEPVYAFLESWIRKTPERWLAMEHLLNYDATPPPCLPQ